jgi:tetratricopeptide (TPR) repeat protein
VLAVASDHEPQNPDPLDAHAQVLIENQRYDEAHLAVEESLQKLPLSVRMYERAIALFSSCGDDEKAVEAARQGTRAYPRGAYMWLLLGRTLRERPQFAAPVEIEECFRRSLRLNSSLYESADWLSVLLTEQRRYEDAVEVISALEPRLADPSPAQGRKAWIKRQTGSKREAATDLSEILQKFPGFTWGWNVLLTWLEEDEDWALQNCSRAGSASDAFGRFVQASAFVVTGKSEGRNSSPRC